jgi:hypothetical protein
MNHVHADSSRHPTRQLQVSRPLASIHGLCILLLHTEPFWHVVWLHSLQYHASGSPAVAPPPRRCTNCPPSFLSALSPASQLRTTLGSCQRLSSVTWCRTGGSSWAQTYATPCLCDGHPQRPVCVTDLTPEQQL